MGRPTTTEDHELTELTNSVPQNINYKGAIRRNPTGIESEPELLRTIINEQCLPEGHSTTS